MRDSRRQLISIDAIPAAKIASSSSPSAKVVAGRTTQP
jgi:hypothetical protein